MAVFIYIFFGGVVGLDIRTSIRFKDLIFGALLFVLILSGNITYVYNFLPLEQWPVSDNIVHIIGNMVLLQMLTLNRNAMTYWGMILCRWRNNLAPACGAQVWRRRPASPTPRGGRSPASGYLRCSLSLDAKPIAPTHEGNQKTWSRESCKMWRQMKNA
jgi:hypothetical protein